MPNYEYRCLACGSTFTRLQGMQEARLEQCPECGGQLERLITGGAGFILKGQGFYRNDYQKSACCGQSRGCDHPKRCCEQAK